MKNGPSEKRVTKGKFVPNGRSVRLFRCAGCKYQGSTATWKAPDGEEGTWCYKCAKSGVKSPVTAEWVSDQKWERSFTEVKCCGQWLVCDRFTNTCDRCGRDYNLSGQELAPREQWGEETGETASDILRETW